jgi:large subunit ribosomal protein L19
MHAQEIIRSIEEEQMKSDLPILYIGDTVKVGVIIQEGGKERTQPYEGVIIARRGAGLNQNITVRKTFQGVGVERVFLIHSPRIESIKVLRRAKCAAPNFTSYAIALVRQLVLSSALIVPFSESLACLVTNC